MHRHDREMRRRAQTELKREARLARRRAKRAKCRVLAAKLDASAEAF
jgi:hypothetical protein